MEEKRGKYPKLGSLFLGSLLAIPIGGFTIFYCIFHLVLHIRLKQLVEPFILISLLTLLFPPFLYWAQKNDFIRGGGHRRLFFTAGSYTLLSIFVYIRYGIRVGLLPPEDSFLYYSLGLLGVVGFYIMGFYLRRIISPRR